MLGAYILKIKKQNNVRMRNGKYVLVIAPKEYPGCKYRNKYIYKHVLVWWQHTGELPILNKIIIHHNDTF